ncbi:MAG: glycosyltransferase [Proteobacteria bacterium]|nr:glycosyltransferase [Pseudomonadota bacterium]MBU1418453.1 glycosyltransferase [Pseudomonadota bacterium]MBU1456455.1 glycosyltransferase [Pseudomonadota bacterium]
MAPTADSWFFFDKIYCISIDTRGDRRTEAKKQFADVGLLERVEFELVKKHPDNQEKGIFQSHMLCLNKGLQAGARHILIFEDDILFQGYQPEVLRNATLFLQNFPAWNGFFLGGITTKMTKTDEQSVVNIQYRCLAHAYALNHSFAKRIVQETWNDIPFDDILRRHCKDFFAIYPMIAFQSQASTDNQTIAIDKMRRFFGGLPFIQKTNEFFQRHKTLILCIHLLFLAAITLAIVNAWT